MEVLRARQIAEQAHKKKSGKNGEPYIAHVSRVVKNLYFLMYARDFSAQETEDHAVVAWLHDVIEDHGEDWDNYDFWAELNVAQREGLKCMTHDKNEPYVDYIDRLKYNDIARRVKLADLEDNTDIERQHQLDEKTVERLNKKYQPAKIKLYEIEKIK